MADQAVPVFFQNLSEQIRGVSNAIGTQSVSQVVQTFDGNPKEFKNWIKNIEKYGVLSHLADNQLKLVAYQSSRGLVSDYINRYLTDYPDETWASLKGELKARFAEIQDPHYALALLKTVKQKSDENVQLFAERLLSLSNEAYENVNDNLEMIESQLIGTFIDGLRFDYLRLKLMRENPPTLAAAVTSAMAEQNLRARFELRSNLSQNYAQPTLNGPVSHNYAQPTLNGPVPMEIDHLRPSNRCRYCKKQGHVIQDCRRRKHEINAYTVGQNGHAPGRDGSARKYEYDKNWKDKIDCWNCGKLGHFSKECIQRRQYINKKN